MKTLITFFKATVDWFKKQNSQQQIVTLLFGFVFLLLSILFFIVNNYFTYKKEAETRYNLLSERVIDCNKKTELIQSLEKKIIQQEAFILLINAANDYNPNAMWLTDLTGVVKWVNQAYVKKYLMPKGHTAFDLVGTNGAGIFGELIAKSFQENNRQVLLADKPITFHELISTTKFPVYVNRKTIFIGGMEYEIFEE